MAPRKEAIIDITRDLISSGVDERVRPREIFEVWFYDETIQADAVRIPWDPARGEAFAKSAADRIRAKRFNVPANVTNAFPSLHTLLKNSGELTAFILTDGFQPIVGTPFDEMINREMTKNRDAFYQGNEPFVITLLGREGKWIVGAVHAKLNASIDLPEFPKPPAPAPQVASVKVEEKPKPAIQTAAVATPPPQPVIQTPPPKTPEPEPKKELAIEKPAPVVQAQVEQPAPAVRKAPEPIVVSPEKTVAEVSAPTSTQSQPEPQAPQPIQAVATPPPAKSFPWPILLAIFGLIAAGGIYVYSRIKETPPTPTGSLISQAYDSNKDENLPRLRVSPGTRLKINLPPTNPPIQQERPKRQQGRDEHQA